MAEDGKAVQVKRGGKKQDVGVGEVVVGDVVIIRSGMEISGDGYVIEACMLEMDESSLTGESSSMKKDTIANCLTKKQECEKTGSGKVTSPILLSGTRVTNGLGKYVVINVGPNSAIGKIKEMIAEEDDPTPLQMKLETIARDIGQFG